MQQVLLRVLVLPSRMRASNIKLCDTKRGFQAEFWLYKNSTYASRWQNLAKSQTRNRTYDKIQTMATVTFYAHGHKNILATHYSTLEFTSSEELSLRGDCIVGVNCKYSLEKLKKLKGNLSIYLEADGIKDICFAEVNPEFKDIHEMVIRKSQYKDQRTFAINCTKAAKDIKRELIEKLKDPKAKLNIIIEEII